VYPTCLYCTAPLGVNDAFETLPIGRRFAFDPAVGRLWVICVGCARWNLVPFESRLETIDDCERTFRLTRTRFSTDHIGLARLHNGMELVRIGPALRPEFASWRYGRMFRRRRLGFAGHGHEHTGGIAGRVQSGLAGIARLMILPLVDQSVGARAALAEHRVIRDPWTNRLIPVPVAAMLHASLEVDRDRNWVVEIPYRTGHEEILGADPLELTSIRDHPGVGLFRGDTLLPTLGRTLPVLDTRRPRAELVTEATRLLERTMGDPAKLLPYVSGRPMHLTTRRSFPLVEVAPELRLAFEMAAHEETEQRAMRGELALLERDWREAERVASVADGLELGLES